MNQYIWYECLYPKASVTYFVNIQTGSAFNAVPADDPDCHLVKELPLNTDLDDSSPFYISFTICCVL